MEITNVSIINDKLETKDGIVDAPIRFYMEIEDTINGKIRVPVSYETYVAVTELIATHVPGVEDGGS